MTTLAQRTIVIGGAALLFALAAIGLVRATAPEATSAPAAAAAVAPAAVAPVPGTNSAALAPADNALGAGDGFGAELDALLAADQTTAAPAANGTVARAAIARGALRRLAAARRLVHATVVVDLKNGGLTTIQLDHGTVSTVGTTSLTIAEAGGGSVTVTLGADTRVRRDGAKAAIADLKTADEVFVMSKVAADGTTAYLVVVPKA